jgi:hypothetical protein
MLAQRGAKWAQTYPQVFKSWNDRRNDKNPSIRMIWNEYVGSMLASHPDLTEEMERKIHHSKN